MDTGGSATHGAVAESSAKPNIGGLRCVGFRHYIASCRVRIAHHFQSLLVAKSFRRYAVRTLPGLSRLEAEGGRRFFAHPCILTSAMVSYEKKG